MNAAARSVFFGAVFLGLSFLIPCVSHAQKIYFSDSDAKLWIHDVATQATTFVTETHDVNAPNVLLPMLDIAFDSNGNLFGYSSGKLYKINPKNGDSVAIGPQTTIQGTAMVFDSNNVLWVLGSGFPGQPNGPHLMKVNTQTGMATFVAPAGAMAAGDLAFDPLTNKLYLSAFIWGGPTAVVEIDMVTGNATPHGDFGPNSPAVYGMDFTGNGQKLVGMSNGTMIYMDNTGTINNPLWAPTATFATPVLICSGASIYRCASNSVPKLNGSTDTPQHLKYDDAAIISGDESEGVAKYEWSVSGKNMAGITKTVTLSGLGTPETIDLIHDPQNRFADLELNYPFEQQTRGPFTITLTTSCDLNKAPHSKTIVFYIDAVALPDYDVFVPNAFSPNGDGNNDVFRACFTSFTPSFVSLEIYNRWGQRVANLQGQDAAWDGKFQGKDAELGVYMFILTYEAGSTRKSVRGDVTLLR